VKAGTIARWVRSGQVVELYDLATGSYIGELTILEAHAGKAKIGLPRGLGVDVRDGKIDSVKPRPDTPANSTNVDGLRAS
jgi:hypothetical protein